MSWIVLSIYWMAAGFAGVSIDGIQPSHGGMSVSITGRTSDARRVVCRNTATGVIAESRGRLPDFQCDVGWQLGRETLFEVIATDAEGNRSVAHAMFPRPKKLSLVQMQRNTRDGRRYVDFLFFTPEFFPIRDSTIHASVGKEGQPSCDAPLGNEMHFGVCSFTEEQFNRMSDGDVITVDFAQAGKLDKKMLSPP